MINPILRNIIGFIVTIGVFEILHIYIKHHFVRPVGIRNDELAKEIESMIEMIRAEIRGIERNALLVKHSRVIIHEQHTRTVLVVKFGDERGSIVKYIRYIKDPVAIYAIPSSRISRQMMRDVNAKIRTSGSPKYHDAYDKIICDFLNPHLMDSPNIGNITILLNVLLSKKLIKENTEVRVGNIPGLGFKKK